MISIVRLVAASTALVIVACGGGSAPDGGGAGGTGFSDDGGGSSGTGISMLSGNVSSSTTSGLEGVEVVVRAEGLDHVTTTDVTGSFAIANAPSGDYDVVFRTLGCEASEPFVTVVNESMIELQNVDLMCAILQIEEIAESFEGVVERVQSQTFRACVDSGGANRLRTVLAQSATFLGEGGGTIEFEDLEVGDRVVIAGARQGGGANSAIDAETVQVEEKGTEVTCSEFET